MNTQDYELPQAESDHEHGGVCVATISQTKGTLAMEEMCACVIEAMCLAEPLRDGDYITILDIPMTIH